MNILVVEDDAAMQRLLATYLTARGYQVRRAVNGREAIDAILADHIDLVLLDIYLPGDLDGIETCRRMRAITAAPIILVTAADRTDTKVMALDGGGDDYVTKPFQAEELLARIRSVMRRAHGTRTSAGCIRLGDLTVDIDAREVRRGRTAIHLTRIEFDLLVVLLQNVGRTLTYEQILRAVWEPGYTDIHPIHVHMSNLRRKLGVGQDAAPPVVAVAGVGYRLCPDSQPEAAALPSRTHLAAA